MIRDSVAEPQETADRLLALRPRTQVVLEGALLVSVVDALLLGVLGGGMAVMPTPQGEMAFSPFAHTAVLLASLILSAGALQVGGQMLGGKGRFAEALLLVVWLEVLAIVIQAVTLLAALVVPPLAGVLGLLGLAVLIWCVVHFARALHGFAGYARTIGALLLGGVVVVVGVSLLLAMLGFGGSPDV
jgi:hypothetical protein